MLEVALIGLLWGFVGQGFRVLVGLKKSLQVNETFDLGRFVLSLVLGAAAGAVSALGISEFGGNTTTSGVDILAILTAGYAGSDFIEGILKKR